MAYVVGRPNGSWEIRETVSSSAGPRSRTLASFRELSPETIGRAVARASKPLTADEVRQAARRAGVPVGLEPVDRAAAELLRELGDGRQPHPILRALLLDALQDTRPLRIAEAADRAGERGDTPGPLESSHNARASAAWLTATAERRGQTLAELLDLSDALPDSREARMERPRFPALKERVA